MQNNKILKRITLNLENIIHLRSLSLPIHEYRLSFYLLRLSFVYFNNVL